MLLREGLKGTLSGGFNACPVHSAVLYTINVMLNILDISYQKSRELVSNLIKENTKQINHVYFFSPQVPLFPRETERVWC